jgi:hypothetical protein
MCLTHGTQQSPHPLSTSAILSGNRRCPLMSRTGQLLCRDLHPEVRRRAFLQMTRLRSYLYSYEENHDAVILHASGTCAVGRIPIHAPTIGIGLNTHVSRRSTALLGEFFFFPFAIGKSMLSSPYGQSVSVRSLCAPTYLQVSLG